MSDRSARYFMSPAVFKRTYGFIPRYEHCIFERGSGKNVCAFHAFAETYEGSYVPSYTIHEYDGTTAQALREELCAQLAETNEERM